MADLTVNAFASGSALLAEESAAAAGDTVPNYTGGLLIVVSNGHADNPRTVTFNSHENCNQGADHDLAVVVAAEATRLIVLPGPHIRWRNASTGALNITYSDSAADVTIGVFRLP